MVQLRVFSEEKQQYFAKYDDFPVRIGRGKNCQLKLNDTGVWENHLELDLNNEGYIVIRAMSGATAMINGQPLDDTQLLRNGDLIEIGLINIQFELGAVRQKNLTVRETAVWTLLVAVTIIEIYLILWLD